MQLNELVAYLNDYLAISDVTDYPGAFNGLQVDGRPEVRSVAIAVDACQATIDRATADGADMLLVHHGLMWGATAPVTGAYYRRLSALICSGMSLYASHLPLDAHPEVGNSHVLARMLQLTIDGRFGEHASTPLGVWCNSNVELDELVQRLGEALHVQPLLLRCGPDRARRVGVITGGAGSMIREAVAAGCDTFITGEGAHHTYFDAEEYGINVIYAGHYATETVGVLALGQHLERQFGLHTVFIDHPTGL